MTHLLLTDIFELVFALIICFTVFRFITLWYFRINEIVELQQQQLEALEALCKKVSRLEAMEKEKQLQSTQEEANED